MTFLTQKIISNILLTEYETQLPRGVNIRHKKTGKLNSRFKNILFYQKVLVSLFEILHELRDFLGAF